MAALVALPCLQCTNGTGGPEPMESLCADGVDNDGDSFVDCSDMDCSFACGSSVPRRPEPHGDLDGGQPDGEASPDHPYCTPGEVFCYEGSRRQCNDDYRSSTVLEDCASPPYSECTVGRCRPGSDAEGPCCVAAEPFCHVSATVEGKEPVDVAYRGLWDNDHACTGSIAPDGYNWSLWARTTTCNGPFLRITLSGYLDRWQAGQTYSLCQQGGDGPEIQLLLHADRSVYNNLSERGSEPEGCHHVAGTVTFHEYGSEPGQAFRITIDGTVYDAAADETRSLRVESSGVLAPYGM
jgi:hypothetical protein